MTESEFILFQVFPEAHVIGVDLSPYFISVANFRAKEKAAPLVSFGRACVDLCEHHDDRNLNNRNPVCT